MGNTYSNIPKTGTFIVTTAAMTILTAGCNAYASNKNIFGTNPLNNFWNMQNKLGKIGVYATVIVGGFLIMAAIHKFNSYVYTRCGKTDDDKPTIQQVQSKVKYTTEQLGFDYSGAKGPKWTKITMSQEEFNFNWKNIKKYFNEDYYQRRVKQLYSTHGSKKIMKSPCKMACCKDLEPYRECYAEQIQLEMHIQFHKKCLICDSEVTSFDYIELDSEKFQSILGFRSSLANFYKRQTKFNQIYWKNLIDRQFGLGYTHDHLDKFKPT